MKRIGEFLAPTLRRATSQRSSFTWLAGTWPAIVGKRLADHTRPSKIVNGILEIAVSGKEWRAGLEDVAGEFRTRINEAWGGSFIREVRFAEDRKGRPQMRHEHDNEHTPFLRARKISTKPRSPSAPDGGRFK